MCVVCVQCVVCVSRCAFLGTGTCQPIIVVVSVSHIHPLPHTIGSFICVSFCICWNFVLFYYYWFEFFGRCIRRHRLVSLSLCLCAMCAVACERFFSSSICCASCFAHFVSGIRMYGFSYLSRVFKRNFYFETNYVIYFPNMWQSAHSLPYTMNLSLWDGRVCIDLSKVKKIQMCDSISQHFYHIY